MLDLFLIPSLAAAVGAAIGQATFIVATMQPYNLAPAVDVSFEPTEFVVPADSRTAEEASQWSTILEESKEARVKLAARALANCPDVACDSVARAFHLHPLSVRRLSKGNRKGTSKTCAYSDEEIYHLAAAL